MEIFAKNTETLLIHKLLFELREAKDTTTKEIQEIDECLDYNFTKYIFSKKSI